MARGYPAEFRRKVLDLIEAGRPVAGVGQQLGVTGQSSVEGVIVFGRGTRSSTPPCRDWRVVNSSSTPSGCGAGDATRTRHTKLGRAGPTSAS